MAEEHPLQAEQMACDFRQGLENGYDYFFRKYYSSLCFMAAKILQDRASAEDIVQDCFLKLWENRKKAENARDIKSYLYTAVHHAAIDNLRKRRRMQSGMKQLAAGSEGIADNTLHEQLVIEAETIRAVYAQISRLPERIKQVFELYYGEGKSYREISDLLDTSPETIRKQKSRAIAILKEILFFSCIIFL